MNERQIRRGRSAAGFTVAELLITLIIISLAFSTAAAALPVAVRAYHSVTNAANAQMLLSTTLVELRSELGTATEVIVQSDKSVRYSRTGDSGGSAEITFVDDGETPGIRIRTMDSKAEDGKGSFVTRMLVSEAATTKELQLTASVDIRGKYLVIKDIVVKNRKTGAVLIRADKDGDPDKTMEYMIYTMVEPRDERSGPTPDPDP